MKEVLGVVVFVGVLAVGCLWAVDRFEVQECYQASKVAKEARGEAYTGPQGIVSHPSWLVSQCSYWNITL